MNPPLAHTDIYTTPPHPLILTWHVSGHVWRCCRGAWLSRVQGDDSNSQTPSLQLPLPGLRPPVLLVWKEVVRKELKHNFTCLLTSYTNFDDNEMAKGHVNNFGFR